VGVRRRAPLLTVAPFRPFLREQQTEIARNAYDA
jgi:hypothetical protein